MKKYLTSRNLIIAVILIIVLGALISALTAHGKITATALATPTKISATPTNVFDATKATGAPTVGATVQNFVKRYGQPMSFGTGNSPNFNDQTTILNVRFDAHGIVTYIGVLGPVEWNSYQTMLYCIDFLPSKAVVQNVTGTLTNYNTNVGQVVINNPGQGTCTVYLGS